jgi:DNA polymerase III alpha subunit
MKSYVDLNCRTLPAEAKRESPVGAELSLEDGKRLTLLCMNREGYSLLCHLITMSHDERAAGKSGMSEERLIEFLEKSDSRGLIALLPGESGYDYVGYRGVFSERIYLTFLPTGSTAELEKTALLSRSFQIPVAPDLTAEILQQCAFTLAELRYFYPHDWIPPGYSTQSYLVEIAQKAVREKLFSVDSAVFRQLQRELRRVEEFKLADYFLHAWSMAQFARSRNILMVGRGSWSESVLCFGLDISSISPEFGGAFTQRLDQGSPELETFHCDFNVEQERRDEVLQFIGQQYGTGRIGFLPTAVNARTESLVLSGDPIKSLVPLQSKFCQWGKRELRDLGILTLDLVASNTLGVMRKTFELLKIQNISLGLTEIPLQDPKTYGMICRAETIGVFPLESPSQRSQLLNARPDQFAKLVIEFGDFSLAFLAYAATFLKLHYPREFICVLLNSQPMGFYSAATLTEEARRLGVEILPVHVYHSLWNCRLERNGLRLGWRTVIGLEKKDAERLIDERSKLAFAQLGDFLSRVRFPLSLLFRLALADVFSSFGLSKTEALWDILNSTFNIDKQLNLFLALNPSKHPLCHVKNELRTQKKITKDFQESSEALKQISHNKIVSLAGLILFPPGTLISQGTIKATLMDECGTLQLILHAQTYEKYKALLDANPFVVVTGKVERTHSQMDFIVGHISSAVDT